MITDLQSFMREAESATRTFNMWAGSLKPRAVADHLCYKCADAEEFARIRAFFETDGSYLYQSWISGRRIAVIRLPDPIATPLGSIGFLELSDQKPDASQKSGFDHVEIHPPPGSATSASERLALWCTVRGTSFTKADRPHHVTYDAVLDGGLKIRIEPERLVDKIMRDEMGN